MEFSERVKALTQDALLPKVKDNVLNDNIVSLRFMGNAKKGKGESIKKAIKVSTSGYATSFSGLDTFSAAPLDTKVRLSYDMRGARIPVAISGMEAVANDVGETQVTDLVKNAVEESQMELMDLIGTMFYGDGTGNSNKDFIGLGAIVDDGTDVSTIGGQSRSTYSVLNATRTASGGTMSLEKLATLYSNISSGNKRPSIIVSDETVWDLYESLLTPTVREQYSMMGYPKVGRTGGATREEGLKGTAGFVALTYKGLPWVADEKATAQNVYMINEDSVEYYGWDASKAGLGYKSISATQSTFDDSVYEDLGKYSGFSWSGFRTPTNQFAGVADIVILGNMVTWEPRRNGRLTGVTSV